MANLTKLSEGHFEAEVPESDDLTHNCLTRALGDIAYALSLEETIAFDSNNLHVLQLTRLSDHSYFVEVVLRPNVD